MECRSLSRAGLTAEALRQVDHLIAGCGGLVMEILRHTAGASTLKEDQDQRLSEADQLADRILREQLSALVPGSSGYSEEGGEFGSPRASMHVRWLIDPVDGTRPATLGGAFAVSIGALLVEDERPLAAVGWVYVPTLSLLYRGILAEDGSECLLNGSPASAERLTPEILPRRHLAVNSDWHAVRPGRLPMKLAAMGATAVHLVHLVHPGSDVAAAALTRYRPYDAAGALPVAVAGGCSVYLLDAHGRPAEQAEDPLAFLYAGSRRPGEPAPWALVATPEAAEALR